MSKSQAPAPPGQPVHGTKVRIIGPEPGTPEFNAVLDNHQGQIDQFIRAQHQRAKLSGLSQHKASIDTGEVRMTYRNNEGQDTVDVEVSTQVLERIRNELLPPLYDQEFGGYILIDVEHFPEELGLDGGGNVIPTVPISFVVELNGQAIVAGDFSMERDNSFDAVVLFGKNALKYHSHRDARNAVAPFDHDLIGFPSPKLKTDRPAYDTNGNPDTGDLPEYEIFMVPGGFYSTQDMTLWDACTTPLSTSGTPPFQDRFYGGGVSRYDDISRSPLIKNGKNKLTINVSAPSNVTVTGYVLGEFFSRNLRKVLKTWRFTAAHSQDAFLNDRNLYFKSSYTNKSSLDSGADFLPYGNFYFPYNSIPGTITGTGPNGEVLTADAPNALQDTAVMVRELIFDLSK